MIQRIQSLYLLAVFLLSVTLFFVPLYSYETTGISSLTHDLHLANCTSSTYYLILNSMVGLLTLIIIVLYKNRTLQVRLTNINMLITCVFIGAIFYFADHSGTGNVSTVHYKYGIYFPLVQLVFMFLAMRAIRKDEALVRSSERLR